MFNEDCLTKLLKGCNKERIMDTLDLLHGRLMRFMDISKELTKKEKQRIIEILKSMEIEIISHNPLKVRIESSGVRNQLKAKCIKLAEILNRPSIYRVKLIMNPQRTAEILRWLLDCRFIIKIGKGIKVIYAVSPFYKEIFKKLENILKSIKELEEYIKNLRNLPETIEDFAGGIKYYLLYYLRKENQPINSDDIILEKKYKDKLIEIKIYIIKCEDFAIYKYLIYGFFQNLNFLENIKINSTDIPQYIRRMFKGPICGYIIRGEIKR